MIFNQSYGSGGGGIYPTIVVTAPTGSTVTCAMGDTTLTATEQSGTWTFQIPDLGTWTVTATLDGNTKTSEVLVNKVKTYNVTISFVSTTLNDNDWATIKSVSDAGTGANYWSVGDCKEVTLNGTIKALTLTNYKTYAFILGFNHNADLEGNNRIHFQIGKTASTGGIDICLTDSYYGDYDGGFRMNTKAYSAGGGNIGGWASSDMRKSICGTSVSSYSGTIIATIPSELRSVLKSVTKYTDNTGNQSSAASAVTSTTDYFFLLSPYECWADTGYANSNESSKQKKYDYYSAGNSMVKYKNSATTVAAKWWLRSPSYRDNYEFCIADEDGSTGRENAITSQGFTPCFCV